MYVMPNGGTAQGGGGDINSALQSLRSAVGYARPPGGGMDPNKRRALPTGKPGGISAMPAPGAGPGMQLDAIKPLIDSAGGMQQSPPWAGGMPSAGQDQVRGAMAGMKPDLQTLQADGLDEKAAGGVPAPVVNTLQAGIGAKLNEMQDGGMPQEIPGAPASGPIMDPAQQAPQLQTAMQNFQGRAGGMQPMGPGRFGGAPPANVLARRQALNGRLRNRLAQFAGGAAGGGWPPPSIPPGGSAELGGGVGGVGFNRGQQFEY